MRGHNIYVRILARQQCEQPLFSNTHSVFGRRQRAREQSRDLVFGQQSEHRVPMNTPFWLVPGQSTALYSLLTPIFKMAFDKAKWSSYVRSPGRSGNQGVYTAPFFASTQALAGSRARRGVSHYKAAKEVITNQ